MKWSELPVTSGVCEEAEEEVVEAEGAELGSVLEDDVAGDAELEVEPSSFIMLEVTGPLRFKS